MDCTELLHVWECNPRMEKNCSYLTWSANTEIQGNPSFRRMHLDVCLFVYWTTVGIEGFEMYGPGHDISGLDQSLLSLESHI